MSAESKQKPPENKTEQYSLRGKYLALGKRIWNGDFDVNPSKEKEIDEKTGLVKNISRNGEKASGIDWISSIPDSKAPRNKDLTPDEKQALLDDWLVNLGAKMEYSNKVSWKFDAEMERGQAIMNLAFGKEPEKLLATIDALNTVRLITDSQVIPGSPPRAPMLTPAPPPVYWGPGSVTDAELVDLLRQYNLTYTDQGEAGLIPESITSLSTLHSDISNMAQIPGLLGVGGGKQAFHIGQAIRNQASKPQEMIRLKKYEGAGIPEIQAMAPQIIRAPDWAAALAAAGSNETLLETIGDVLAMDGTNRITNAPVVRPVAKAFRWLEYWSNPSHPCPAVDKKTGNPLNEIYPNVPLNKRDEIKLLISAQLAGVPYVPGQDAGGLLGYVEIAEMIWKMTWRAAELGDPSVNYAFKTYNLHIELMGDRNVNQIFKEGQGKDVLMRNRRAAIHVATFWETLADQIGDAQAEAVGLKVRISGLLQMASSFEAVAVEDIDWTSPVKPLLITVANGVRKADLIRDQATKRGFLNSAELPGFMNAIKTGAIFNDLKGLPYAQTVCALFDVIAEYDLKKSGKPFQPDYTNGLGSFISSLAETLDFKVPGVEKVFKELEKKYRNDLGRNYKLMR